MSMYLNENFNEYLLVSFYVIKMYINYTKDNIPCNNTFNKYKRGFLFYPENVYKL